ncbi:adenosine receptor A1 [Nematostella vectensis]|uniref:adenosine receptor A1 n=1 Tax=Nematostella vectensis TaxID=45351 RepID=UPI002076F1E5|nr:adenosine receptor A1 [Nematostella vectensis]
MSVIQFLAFPSVSVSTGKGEKKNNKKPITINTTSASVPVMTTSPPSSTSSPRADYAFFVTKAICYTIVTILILLANVICLLVFLTSRRMRTRPYLLLVSLSVADFLVGVSVFEKIPQLELSNGDLVIRSNLGFLADPASLYTLTAIAIERLIATMFPYFHRGVGLWLYVLLAGLPWLMGFAVMMTFIGIFYLGTPRSAEFYLFLTIPFSLGLILLAYISLALSLSRSRIVTQNPGAAEQRALRNRKLAITLAFVTLASLLAWCPYGLYEIALIYCNSCTKSARIIFALKLLRYLNSAVNVVVYVLRMPEFNRYMTALFRKCSSRVDPSNDHSTQSCDHTSRRVASAVWRN